MGSNIFRGWWKFPRFWLHLVAFLRLDKRVQLLIESDILEMNKRYSPDIERSLFFYLKYQKPYRNLFYNRVGPVARYLKMFARPYPFFYLDVRNGIGAGAYVLNHPYSTIINAKVIGDNFTCCQLTTIGNAQHGRNDMIPSIGNNVSLGANVTIIGDVSIGNNVIVGAGSVVTKDIPNNCVVVGNPARILRYLE